MDKKSLYISQKTPRAPESISSKIRIPCIFTSSSRDNVPGIPVARPVPANGNPGIGPSQFADVALAFGRDLIKRSFGGRIKHKRDSVAAG